MFTREVNLNSWNKSQIDKNLLKELSSRSNFKGINDVVIFLLALLKC